MMTIQRTRVSRITRLHALASTVWLLALTVMPSLVQVSATSGQYIDTTDDFYVYTPRAYKATACYQTADYSSLDIVMVSWENSSGNLIFNITFQENVDLSKADVALYFFANASYASAADIPPYSFKQSFLIDFCPEWNPRICYNYTLQKYFTTSIHGNILELTLPAAHAYILDPIQDKLPMDQWFCVGWSFVELDGAEAFDYVNWPRRFANDQLWLTYDPYYWEKIVIASAAILGVALLVLIVILKKKRGSKSPAGPGKEGFSV